jgi:ABC-type phosphate/phosphonate transport system substrate-binding protein
LLLGLFFKKVDAVVVFKASYDLAVQMNPQVGEQIRILDSMPNVPWGVMYFHKNVDPAFRELIIGKLLSIKEDVHGKQLLELLKSTQFVRTSLSDLAAIDALNDEYNQLLRKHK